MTWYTIQDYRGEHDPDEPKRDFRTAADRYWEPRHPSPDWSDQEFLDKLDRDARDSNEDEREEEE